MRDGDFDVGGNDCRGLPGKGKGRSPAVLVRMIAAGDGDAEAELVHILAPRLRRAAARHCDVHADREDLLSDLWEMALPRLRQGCLRDSEAVSSYLMETLRKIASNARRTRERRRVLLLAGGGDLGDAITRETPELLTVRYQELAQLRAAIARLPAERDREVLRALLLQQHPEYRVAARLGLTPAQLTKIASRARARLRSALSPSVLSPDGETRSDTAGSSGAAIDAISGDRCPPSMPATAVSQGGER